MKYFFSAPGRTELGGNHTDHQHGRVLAAAVDLDARAAVELNGSDVIRVRSEGYAPCEIRLFELEKRADEVNTTASLVRGVAARFKALGASLKGFDMDVSSSVPAGSGLSSSAAFEVLLGTVMNELFYGGRADATEIAQTGQWAENEYFGKPCGLMDQMASSWGGVVGIDFADPAAPKVEHLAIDFEAEGYALCIIDSGAGHEDLTDEYAAVPADMKAVAGFFGKPVLREVPEAEFLSALPRLRDAGFGDRAILRAMHFYGENERVSRQLEALSRGDFEAFLALVRESGRSSWQLLQNVIPAGAKAHQELAFALAYAERLLDGAGAVRVHGGGFAGTIQAYVPLAMLGSFKERTESVLGSGSCHVLHVRAEGGVLVRTEG